MWLGRVQGHGPPPKGCKASAGKEEDPAEETAEGHGGPRKPTKTQAREDWPQQHGPQSCACDGQDTGAPKCPLIVEQVSSGIVTEQGTARVQVTHSHGHKTLKNCKPGSTQAKAPTLTARREHLIPLGDERGQGAGRGCSRGLPGCTRSPGAVLIHSSHECSLCRMDWAVDFEFVCFSAGLTFNKNSL